MDNSGQPKPTEIAPPDLLPLIRRSGILSDRQFEEISGKVRSSEYPAETRALAERLTAEGILTLFQASRLLQNKAHGLVVGPYVILDRLGAGGRGLVFRAQHRLMGRMARAQGDRPPDCSASQFDRPLSSGNAVDWPTRPS